MTSSRWRHRATSWRRQLVKLGQFTRAWLVLCRRMEFFAHMWSQRCSSPSAASATFTTLSPTLSQPSKFSQHGPPPPIPSYHDTLLGPFYWLVVRQDDHHGLSGYGVLSPWHASTAIYSATAPSNRSSQGCRT